MSYNSKPSLILWTPTPQIGRLYFLNLFLIIFNFKGKLRNVNYKENENLSIKGVF